MVTSRICFAYVSRSGLKVYVFATAIVTNRKAKSTGITVTTGLSVSTVTTKNNTIQVSKANFSMDEQGHENKNAMEGITSKRVNAATSMVVGFVLIHINTEVFATNYMGKATHTSTVKANEAPIVTSFNYKNIVATSNKKDEKRYVDIIVAVIGYNEDKVFESQTFNKHEHNNVYTNVSYRT